MSTHDHARPEMDRRTVSKSAILKTYEEIAEGVEEKRQSPWTDLFEFETTLDRHRRILEIGCGSGRNVVHFASTGHWVIALDIARGMLALAVKRVRGRGLSSSVHFLQGDAVSLPLKDETADACLYVAVLHHLPTRQERLASLNEVARCLRRGGKVLISVWAFEQKRFQHELRAHQEKKGGFGDITVPISTREGKVLKRFYHLFVKEELEELVAASGLGIERHFKSHDNYFVVAVRT